jgi:bacterioferritin (cytochrome b1)
MPTQREDMKRLLALYRDGRVTEEELLARFAPHDDTRVDRDDEPRRRELAELLDGYRAAEASGAETIAAWAEASPDPRLAGALRVVAAREAAHAAVLERRVRELGHEPCARIPSWLERYNEALLAENACDEERLTAVVGRFPDIQAALAPLRERIDSLDDDPLTRELLRAIAEDEEATLRWMHTALAERKRRGS